MFGSARRVSSSFQKEENVKTLDNGERALVSLGAALTSNSAPCVEYYIAEARKAGFGTRQLEEAVRLAEDVRRVPAGKIFAAALHVVSDTVNSAAATPGGKQGSVSAEEQQATAASGKPDDGPGPERSRSDRRCCC
jgi:4-carboxymuconolactone decarboxylase